MASYCDTLTILDRLEELIYQDIERGQVSDRADKELTKLRQRSGKLNTTIKETLQKYLQTKKYQSMLQDFQIIQKIITILFLLGQALSILLVEILLINLIMGQLFSLSQLRSFTLPKKNYS